MAQIDLEGFHSNNFLALELLDLLANLCKRIIFTELFQLIIVLKLSSYE